MAMVTLRLDDESNLRLTQAAARSGRTKSQILRALIMENIDAVEKLPSISEDLAELRNAKAEGRMLSQVEFTASISDLLD